MKNSLRVLLLGGSGFVGRNILEQLSSKYIFLAPTHKELDLLDEKAVINYFIKHNPDVIVYAVNLGGTRKNPSKPIHFYQNIRMFFNVTRANKYFKKMIFLGSGAEYDKRNPLIKVKEIDFDKHIPVDEYGYYKYICSNVIEQSDNIVNLRIFGLFGKYEDYEIRFISNTICKNIFNLPITINQNVFFDYVYINDFIHILDYFIENNVKHKSYNIGTGNSIDLLSLAKKINSLSQKKQKISILKKGLGTEYTCNNKRLIKELQHFSFTPIEKSIEELYNWYTNNKTLKKKSFIQDYI